ncbi:MAG: MarR family transcriptional regulator [Anaerolineae bacterium]|nr:MarR family transcriptional regulator [Anaerolineae bacterium]
MARQNHQFGQAKQFTESAKGCLQEAVFFCCSVCSVLTEQTEQDRIYHMDEQNKFIDDIGFYFENLGLQRTGGRIMAYLMICEPPYQSMPELVEALQASKSTISVALWQLQTFHLVERFRLPGKRREYFRLGTEIWERSLQARMDEMAGFKQLAMRGLHLLEGKSPEVRQRLEQMDEFFGFFQREFPKLMEQWRELRRQKTEKSE